MDRINRILPFSEYMTHCVISVFPPIEKMHAKLSYSDYGVEMPEQIDLQSHNLSVIHSKYIL